jgi:epidermal growth factor receptor substrate 15
MHLLTSYKSGALRGIPATLPPGLYDAAARRGSAPAPARASFGSRPEVPPVPTIPKQFTGPHRTTSPLNPASRQQFGGSLSAQVTGGDWLITPPEKVQFDSIFETVDTAKLGFITGDQAVSFFMKAQLPEETLAQIWDLADIDADGQLSRDEFAVAMYLVRLQRGGKEPLPQVVPPALIPPSMRRQAPAPMAAPAPPPAPAPSVRTAADDLFGLDSPAPPFAQPQMPQSTGGSNSAWQIPASPSRGSPQTASNIFKPFVPSSTFGQSLQPQMTGASAGTPVAARSPPPPSDDLLGDNDPEESNKLTQETTELANLSNQIGSLAKEMHTVQEKRTSAEQNITQTSQQKRDFETRLAQARSMYEQEVAKFKALEERLKSSKAETEKLSQQYALLEGSRQDLQNQYTQVATALAADEQENASLKEKIRQANAEVAQLKPALEKARSGARQQKGLVAINKKQLATVEGERDKIQGEIDGFATETPQYSEDGSQTPSGSVPEVTSPAASTASQNTNPFFRRAGSSSEQARSPGVANDQQKAFDSLFGQSFAGSAAGPPPTSFRSESPQVAVSSPHTSAAPTPSVSPPPGPLPGAFPSGTLSEPPAPSQSRQLTPNFLQFNDTQSVTSSTMVSPPASRFGGPDTSGFGTPTQDVSDYGGAASIAESSDYSRAPTSTVEGTPARSPFEEEGLDASTKFPEVPAVATNEAQSATSPTHLEGQGENKDLSFDELFGSKAHKRSESQQGNDFEEAFATMKQTSGAERTNGAASAGASEFPPIQELHHDTEDDDSSDDEHVLGFDDDFTPAAPNALKDVKPDSIDAAQLAAFPVPGNNAKPPSPDAQQSPPAYDTAKEDNTHLPPQFDGLLPERADPTVAPDAPHSVEHATGAPVVSNETQRDSISETGLPAGGAKVGGPDFEAAFAGMNLAPAAEADDEDDDEPGSQDIKNTNDFDFSFDSPSQTQQPLSATNTGQGNSSEFFSFDNNVQAPTQPVASPAEGGSKPAAHEWDALFAPLDNAQSATGKESTDERSKQPGWALNNDSGEDDLILQRLTGMGFTRDESLDALEKYDYNLDKVSSTFHSTMTFTNQ